MEKKVLVYQAYGSDEILRQAAFSAISLFKHISESDDLEVWFYTDKRAFFENLFDRFSRIKLFEISTDQLDKWRGPAQFVHRVKIEILIDAGAKFKGSLFYCDGDTYFRESPMAWFNRVNDRNSLMHVAEGALSESQDPLGKKILKFTKKHHFQIRNEMVGIGPSTVMWNAGFIGLSEKNKALLPLILDLTDQSYELYQKHVMEQLAVSFYLQTRSEILPIENCVTHYWDQKTEYQKEIDRFLTEHSNLKTAIEHWIEFQFPEPPAKPERSNLLQKIFHLK